MKLELNEGWLESQPKWWKNFVAYLDTIPDGPKPFAAGRGEFIKNELNKEGAKLCNNDTFPSHLEFDNDAAATLFLIKWS